VTEYIQTHRAAMDAYDRHEAARKQGRHTEARAALHEALALETAAAQGVPAELEPTRSVLFRSAASIALDAGLPADARRLITAALRGNPPAAIKQELLELLDQRSYVEDELRDPAPSLPRGTVLQRLVIRSATPARGSAHALTMAIITKIHDAWIECFEPVLAAALGDAVDEPPRLEAVQAAVGSFAVQLKLSGPLDPHGQQLALEILRELEDLDALELDKSSARRSARSLSRFRQLVALLTMLEESDLQLDVEMRVVGEPEVVAVLFQPLPAAVLRRLQHIAARYIDSAEIPQADQLDRVFALVEHVVQDGVLPSSAQFDVVPRQVAYYRKAAEILGYLRRGIPTPAAGHLARATPEARLRHALQRFEASEIGGAWIAWAEQSRLCEVEPNSAESFLAEASIGLSPSTIVRRAKTLRAWYEAFAAVF
jgi:hypothetical protein